MLSLIWRWTIIFTFSNYRLELFADIRNLNKQALLVFFVSRNSIRGEKNIKKHVHRLNPKLAAKRSRDREPIMCRFWFCGPILFFIYKNVTVDSVDDGTSIRKFADDCDVYRKIDSNEDRTKLNSTLQNILKQCEECNMPLNLPKLKLLHVTKQKL